jgi:hypothetical protein
MQNHFWLVVVCCLFFVLLFFSAVCVCVCVSRGGGFKLHLLKDL